MPDQHYGLPVVVCPTCRLASVRTRHPDIEFWRGFRRVHSAIRTVFAKVFLMVLLSGLMTLLILAAGDVFMPFGRFMPTFPFKSGHSSAILSASGILIGSMLLTTVASVLLRHRPIYQSMLIFMSLTLFILTIDFTYATIGILLAEVGGFPQQHHYPPSRELSLRLSQYGFLFAVSLLGLLPVYPLAKTIDQAPARRFRRVLKKRRKQRANDD